jgi:CBS-domain-containing membrane protein
MKPLLALTAADLMSRDVVMIPQDMGLRAAAHLLSQAGISGAPVVDNHGCCVGVISTTDFMRRLQAEGTLPNPGCAHLTGYLSEWQVSDLDELPTEEVREHMTANPVTISPDTSIRAMARMMLNAHIHRLIVVDAHDRPVGIVSATDVLAAVAHAEEQEQNE